MAFKQHGKTIINNDGAIAHPDLRALPTVAVPRILEAIAPLPAPELTFGEFVDASENKILASDGAAEAYFGQSVAIGDNRIVVGAYGDNDKGIEAGAVYIYDLGRNLITKITASDGAAYDSFGWSVAVGNGRIVVGAQGDDENGTNSGSAYIFDLDGNPVQKITASDGAPDDLFGNSVAIGNNRIVVGAWGNSDNGGNSGSAYIFDLNGNQQSKLTASDGAASDHFGRSVAIGDNRIVVGAWYNSEIGTQSGSAYIFDLNGNQQSKLTASDGAAYDSFGRSVAIGDNKIVVGAHNNDDNGLDSGSAYIFDLNGNEQYKLTASDSAEGDWFGRSVAIGNNRIVVGAYGDDDKGNRSGSAYIFDLNGNELHKLTASDGAVGDWYGLSVAIGNDRIAVGAYRSDEAGNSSGSTYIYELPAPVVEEYPETKMLASDGAAEDRFGYSVAVGDNRIVVGAYLDDVGGVFDVGSVYIFDLNGGEIKKIIASDAETQGWFGEDYFGFSVAVGDNRIVVGAPFDESSTGIETGSVYVFDLDGNEQYKLTASDGSSEDWFGYGVAVGDNRIVVSAPYNDENGTNSGSAYIFDLAGNPVQKITASDGAPDDLFGNSVAIGNNRIVVGAWGNSDNGGNSGSAYIFDLDGNPVQKITASDGVANDRFGFSVAIGSNKIVVGAGSSGHSGDYSGAAYIFNLDGNEQQKITASDGAAYDYFGRSIAVGSNKIVVGAYGDKDNGSISGSAYIFDLDGNEQQKITASDGAASDYFGRSVAAGNNRIVVGAYGDDDNGNNSGSAYIYELSAPVVPVKEYPDTKITASDGAANDWFGRSVAVGDNRIVVGAVFDDDNGLQSGSAYIFDLGGNELHKLTASDGAPDDLFGTSVAIGNNRIVVGAFGANTSSGSAYIYDLSGNELHKLTASNSAINSYFGASVAISNNRIVVGAPGQTSSGSVLGQAYIFDLDGNELHQISPTGGTPGDLFGTSVAIANNRIIIGAPEDTGPASRTGAAYIFDLDGNQLHKITAGANAVVNDQFGQEVAIDNNRIVVGVPRADYSRGCAYVFDLSGNLLHKMAATDSAITANFGSSVAIANNRIVVGAEDDNLSGTSSAGSAYVFDLDGNELTKIVPADTAAVAEFGGSVAVGNNKIVIGASKDKKENIAQAGSVYIVDMTPLNGRMLASDGAPDDWYGYDVAVGSGRLVIGAQNSGRAGAVYLYDIYGNKISKLETESILPVGGYGISVAVGSGRIIVGADKASTSDGGALFGGRAYMLDLGGNELAVLAAPNGNTGDKYGWDVAVGSNRIVVGAPLKTIDGKDKAGAVYFYNLEGQLQEYNSGSTLIDNIIPPSSAEQERFGSSVAVANGVMAIGAPGDRDTYNAPGKVYLYDITGVLITQITADDGTANDEFGISVSVGCGRIVVGARNYSNTRGAVYVFDLYGNQLQKITASDAALGDWFGNSVAVGNNRIVVGAPFTDHNGANSGSTYVFDLDGNELEKLEANDPAGENRYGQSVAIGSGRIIASSYLADINGSNSGSADMYYLPEDYNTYIERILGY